MKHLMNSTAAVVDRFRDNEDGATALSFALGLTVMLSAIGVGMDFTIVSKAHNKAQNIADMAALNAAVYVRENDDMMPEMGAEDGFVDGFVYKATEVGYTFGGMIDDEVKLKVEYDMANRQATSTVWGATKTTFTSFLGHKNMPFESKSTVKFLTRKITAPASVFIVADNSGSMAWHDRERFDIDWNEIDENADSKGESRISGLKKSVKQFMEKLESVAGSQNEGDDLVLRTGLVPYSGTILPTSVDRDWGYLTHAEIDAMEPNLSTNSSPPMAKVKEWMDSEVAIHLEEHNMQPLRYVIFLTDGQNTGGEDMWVPSPGGGAWIGEYCGMERKVTRTNVNRDDPDVDTCYTVWDENQQTPSRLTRWEDFRSGRTSYRFVWRHGWSDQSVSSIDEDYFDYRMNGGFGYVKTRETCKAVKVEWEEGCTTYDAKSPNGNWSTGDVIRSQTDPALRQDSGPSTNMIEGKFVYDYDYDTIKTCNALREDGVKVFSVGYALDPGRYKSNKEDFGREALDDDYMPIEDKKSATQAFDRATALLEQCAFENTDDYFMLAADTTALEKVFEKIGENISEDVVRLMR